MAEFVGFIILAAIIAVIVQSLLGRSSNAKFCIQCGYEGPTKSRYRGSILIEIILWLCLIVPGLIYSIWRHTSTADVCRACGAEGVIPVDSPVAEKMRRELKG